MVALSLSLLSVFHVRSYKMSYIDFLRLWSCKSSYAKLVKMHGEVRLVGYTFPPRKYLFQYNIGSKSKKKFFKTTKVPYSI